MSVTTTTTRVDRRYLERKSKDAVIDLFLLFLKS